MSLPSVDGIVVRKATAADLQGAKRLLETSVLPLDGVEEAFGHFVVAEEGKRLVGVAGLEIHGPDGVLRSVAVDPTLRGRGVGARLSGRVIANAREAGLRRVYLLTTTAETYFPRLGFRPIPREEASPEVQRSVEFREACPQSAIAMVLELEEVKRMSEPLRVLFLCTHNSARSQIAEALLARRGEQRFQVASAGTDPAAEVHPLAVGALQRAGIDWQGRRPKGLDDVLDDPTWDLVITVCDRAKEACPALPGRPVTAHWGIPDPAAATGEDTERAELFWSALTMLSRRIDLLCALPAEKLRGLALKASVDAITADEGVSSEGAGA